MILFFKRRKRRRKNTKGGEINPEDIFVDSSNLAGLDSERLEGSLDKPISLFMEYLPFFLLIFIFTIFIYRMHNLQIVNTEFYKNKSDNNRYNSRLIIANRGEILDRNGKVLAENIVSSSSEILKREYIKTPGFSNLLGYVSSPKVDSSNNFWQEDYQGKDGVELYYQELLNGINGRLVIEKDAFYEIESENLIINPIPGIDLILTIDSDVQEILYSSIENSVKNNDFVSGAGIIMDVNNGEILAITSYPEYDNNLMTNASTEEEKNKITDLLEDKRTPFLNRAISGLFTPGSVVKPFMAYAALVEGIITPEKKILSTGALVIKNIYGGPDSIFRDWKVHGLVNVVEAIARSSDEYFYQVGGGYKDQPGLGISKIDEYANFFGLNTKTQIDLPGEVEGVIPTPEWKRMNFLEGEWLLGDTYHTSIGQYGFQSTPISLVRYTAALANGGLLVTPHIFLEASSTNSLHNKDLINKYNNLAWETQNLNLKENSLRYVREGMRAVVLDGGTVPQLNIKGLDVAAKSGTAEIGLVKGRVNSLMIGYFPYDKPKYAFVVVLENGPEDAAGASWAIRPVLEYLSNNKEDFIN